MDEIKLVLASRNAHKIKEIEAMLGEYLDHIRILSLDDVGIAGEAVEDGASFAENALLKAQFAASSGYISFADDSGLVVPALNGEPGIYSARYAGEHGDDAQNRALLLKRLEGVAQRQAAFACCIACVFPKIEPYPQAEPIVVQGFAEGEILCAERGEGGFGYDNLFWFDEAGKTFAEMTPEEKNLVSHRRHAIAKFAALLAMRFGLPLKRS